MVAEYEALEARVTELEQQVKHMLPARIDAVAYGLSLVHEDVRAARATLDRHDARFDAIDQRLATIDDTLAAHTGRFEGIEDALSNQSQVLSSQSQVLSNQSQVLSSQSQMLREILRRLPE
jgi:uncharacterized coiled-coil protein SlyX